MYRHTRGFRRGRGGSRVTDNGNNARGMFGKGRDNIHRLYDGRREDANRGQGGSFNNHARRTPVPEIKEAQEETIIANFRSSKLTYHGSDRLVFIINGGRIKSVWKKFLKREKPIDQNDIRIFISSALVVADRQSDYGIEEFIKELGNPESGLKRLREIIKFPSMSCDAGNRRDVLSF